MAKAMTDGDTKALFKMMEKGELDPNVALPKFWKLLGEEAQPFMEEYFKSIEYARRRVAVESEQWFKAFMGNGAVEGVTTVFNALATTMNSARGSADLFGASVKNLGYFLSGALLIPKELKEWIRGDQKKGNIFSHFLGDLDFTKVEQISSILSNTFDVLSNVVGTLGLIHSLLVDWKVYQTGGEIADKGLGWVERVTGLLGAITSGHLGDGGVLAYRQEQRAKTYARDQIKADKARGVTYTREEERERFNQLYNQRLEELRRVSGEKGFWGQFYEQLSAQAASVVSLVGIDVDKLVEKPKDFLLEAFGSDVAKQINGSLLEALVSRDEVLKQVKSGNASAVNLALQFPTMFPRAAEFIREQEGKPLPYYKNSHIEVAQEALGSLPNYIPAFGDMEGLSNYFADMYNSNKDLRRGVELSITPVPSTVTNNVEVNITTTEGMSPEDVGDEVRETIVSMFSTTIPVTSFS